MTAVAITQEEYMMTNMTSCCQSSVKTFSHLSSHELPKAWRECESGDQQGDECGIHQAPDRKRGTAGSLMGGPVPPYKHNWFLSDEDRRTINSSLSYVKLTQFTQGQDFRVLHYHLWHFSAAICLKHLPGCLCFAKSGVGGLCERGCLGRVVLWCIWLRPLNNYKSINIFGKESTCSPE